MRRRRRTIKRGGTPSNQTVFRATASYGIPEQAIALRVKDRSHKNYPVAKNVVAVNESEEIPLQEAIPVASTRIRRTVPELLIHHLQKRFGLSKKKVPKMLDLDFDTKLFEDTCIEDIGLPIEEVELFDNAIHYLRGYRSLTKRFIRRVANRYCRVRRIMFNIHARFDEVYPRIFAQVLTNILNEDDISEQEMMQHLRNADVPGYLEELENHLNDNVSFFTRDLSGRINSRLYDESA